MERRFGRALSCLLRTHQGRAGALCSCDHRVSRYDVRQRVYPSTWRRRHKACAVGDVRDSQHANSREFVHLRVTRETDGKGRASGIKRECMDRALAEKAVKPASSCSCLHGLGASGAQVLNSHGLTAAGCSCQARQQTWPHQSSEAVPAAPQAVKKRNLPMNCGCRFGLAKVNSRCRTQRTPHAGASAGRHQTLRSSLAAVAGPDVLEHPSACHVLWRLLETSL